MPDKDPYSECHGCGDEIEAFEVGEEIGVGVCTFVCPCGHEYTVICEITDTARCYECDEDNPPEDLKPPRRINRKTSNKHSCSKCNGRENCPNLRYMALETL